MSFQAPGFTVTKKASHTPVDETNGYAAVGEPVAYEIVAKNNGNVDITGAIVADPMFDGDEGWWCVCSWGYTLLLQVLPEATFYFIRGNQEGRISLLHNLRISKYHTVYLVP